MSTTLPLRRIVNADFIQTVDRLGTSSSSETPAQAAAKRLSGNSQATSLDSALRTGARNFALGTQALTRGISFINVSHAAHEKLSKIVDRLAEIADKSAKGGVGSQEGIRLVQEFRGLAHDFEKISKESEIEGTDVLDPTDLGGVLIASGLDPENSRALEGVFKKLHALNHSEVDIEGNVVTSSALIPTDQFAQSVRQTAGAFDDASAEAEPVSAAFSKIRDSLGDLKERIHSNIKALEDTRNIVIDNLVLARAAGRAFLNLSEQVKGTEEAEAVAQKIRDQIRREAPQALEHAGNLQAIVIAGLTLTAEAVSKK